MAMRSSCYGHCEEALISRRFMRWGGIPRFVFSELSDEEDENEFTNAIALVNLDNIIQLSSIEIERACEESHRILHFVPRGALAGSELKPTSLAYFQHGQLMISSKEAEQKLFLRKIKEDARKFK